MQVVVVGEKLTFHVLGVLISVDINIIRTASAFCNKIWHCSRLLVLAHEQLPPDSKDRLAESQPRLEDQWILSKCAVAVKEVNGALEKHDFHMATRALRRFLYSNLCDIYLVSIKIPSSGKKSYQFLNFRSLSKYTCEMHPVQNFIPR